MDRFSKTGSLEVFLQREIGVEADAALAFLSDGRRLITSNIRDLGSSQDQYIFVFNQEYLESNVEDVLNQFLVEPPFQPAIEDVGTTPPIRHASLAASYARTAQIHHEQIQHTLQSLSLQQQSLQIASMNLDFHILRISETFDEFAVNARKELEKQMSLLEGLDSDLDLLSKVAVHVEFCSTAVRMAIEAGDPQRVLADYVSKQKMKQVGDTCARTHEDLAVRFNQVEEAINKLKEGTASIRSNLADSVLLEEATNSSRRSQDLLERITDASAALETLATLVASFRGKTSFSHIQRLHNMLYAYGATIIEIVRRKEFSRFFYERSRSILEVMAKVSASERKRRQVYRSEIHGQLPFETRGMDDPVPTVDFSPYGGMDFVYSFERSDVDALLQLLDDLEKYAESTANSVPLHAVRECRTALEKLISKMDNLELGFDKIAERSLLSQSHISQSRRRSNEAEEKIIQELAEELRMTQEAKALQEHQLQEDKTSLQTEIRNLSATVVEERSTRLERELSQVRAQMESEAVARRILEERNAELRIEIARALADATEQTRQAERAEFEEMKQLEKRNADKVSSLMEEQAKNLRHLEEARARGEDLELQIQAVRSEGEDLQRELKEASEKKDKLLRDQLSEHDRRLRDHIAEANVDRAVLDRQFSELQAVLEHKELELKDLRGDLEVANADANGLRQELLRVELELKAARTTIQVLRDDIKAGRASQHDFEQRIENSNRLTAQILDVAINFRNSHVKALHVAQAMSSHPSSARHAGNNLAESAFSLSGGRHNIIGQPDEPEPIDPSDPTSALDTLREFDHDHFLEAVNKTGSTIRKWQKQCKEYRDRAKGKISFRNFAKGDLALFLPTRNSVSKPWAAFNVSFPHYFLQATGHLAEQLKTREWIVARITSITERVVDQKDPTSNPYGLGDGVKYYLLEVEDWTQPSHNKRRLSSKKASGGDSGTSKEIFPTGPSRLSPPTLPPGPPEAEVEDTFLVTHPPNSHLFPARQRSNSSPTARPSSLSRLLAQASPAPDAATEPPTDTHPSPPIPPPPSSPSASIPAPQNVSPNANNNTTTNTPSMPSPLRPGSRASRLSTTSRFSVGRIPALGTVMSSQPKASATTALTEQAIAASPSSITDNPFRSPVTSTPTPPEENISDAMTNVLNSQLSNHRRRTSSHQAIRPSPLAPTSSQSTVVAATIVPSRPPISTTSTLTNLANSWGMSFGRKKKTEVGNLTPTAEASGDGLEHRMVLMVVIGAISGSGEMGPDLAWDHLASVKRGQLAGAPGVMAQAPNLTFRSRNPPTHTPPQTGEISLKLGWHVPGLK
ncbi:hypothetical protein CPB84DRAFT_1814678 [Gymnopilus junonius]|uniref:Autophagy-related protein 11 n=1 Tax=Gymnopilus junonius TaxID=109634 RepID=A0A9P5NTG2_GYMJU|nr:hypothetical protein CPB84DRAFT_1814678 [Gymnopilus junonius]